MHSKHNIESLSFIINFSNLFHTCALLPQDPFQVPSVTSQRFLSQLEAPVLRHQLLHLAEENCLSVLHFFKIEIRNKKYALILL